MRKSADSPIVVGSGRAALSAFLICGCVAIGPLIFARPAAADHVGGTPYSGYYFYASDDLHSVDVTLAGVPNTPPVHLKIPRADIISAESYSQRDHGTLPDSISTSRIFIAIILPEGRPYTIEFEKLADSLSDTKLAAKQIRSTALFANLSHSVSTNKGVARWGHPVPAGEFEGLPAVKTSKADENYINYLSKGPSDEFMDIRCFTELNSTFTCNYSFMICKNVYVSAAMLDFRLHGGRDAANSKLRDLKKMISQWAVACD